MEKADHRFYCIDCTLIIELLRTRSISKLRLIKTFSRSTMDQDRLSSLALMNIHRDVDIDFNKVLDIFARDYPHRLLLVDILKHDND